jgi:hypothetical protein
MSDSIFFILLILVEKASGKDGLYTIRLKSLKNNLSGEFPENGVGFEHGTCSRFSTIVIRLWTEARRAKKAASARLL